MKRGGAVGNGPSAFLMRRPDFGGKGKTAKIKKTRSREFF